VFILGGVALVRVDELRAPTVAVAAADVEPATV
jgi:hypothetical protein